MRSGSAKGLPAVVWKCSLLVQGVAFWAATLLPIVYLSLIVIDGDLWIVGALISLNVIALIVGHDYSRTIQ